MWIIEKKTLVKTKKDAVFPPNTAPPFTTSPNTAAHLQVPKKMLMEKLSFYLVIL